MNNFPANLKYLRKKKGLLQSEMESRLGIARTTWSNYENGKTNPAIDDLIRFSSFFGISLDALILHDLAADEQIITKKSGKRKPVAYKAEDTSSEVKEEDLAYVLTEIKKLREEMNAVKKKQRK